MSINEKIKNWNSYQYIYYNRHNNRLKYMLIFIMLAFVVFLFLPWTQSITAKGNVTAFNINERTQQLNSVISGAIEKWYIKEGDFVKAGDTILKLTEVKTEYLDPALLENTRQQLIAKPIIPVKQEQLYFKKRHCFRQEILKLSKSITRLNRHSVT